MISPVTNAWSSFSASPWDRMFLILIILQRWNKAVLETSYICACYWDQISHSIVMLVLRVLYVCAQALKFFTLSISILKQSMIEMQLLKLSLKHMGRLIWICSVDGQCISGNNLICMTSNVLLNTLTTLVYDIPKKIDKKYNGKLSLILINLNRKLWKGVGVGPVFS